MNLKRRRRQLLRLQEGRCFYCPTILDTNGDDPARMDTFDEVIPRSKGGKRERDNVVLACGPCNWRKRNRIPSKEELDRLAELLAREPPLPERDIDLNDLPPDEQWTSVDFD